MANVIKCNTGTLSSDKDQVRSSIKEIRNSLSNLEALSRELDGMWDGEASNAYMHKFNVYLNHLNALCDSLDSITKYENTAISEYNRCERDISGVIESISI